MYVRPSRDHQSFFFYFLCSFVKKNQPVQPVQDGVVGLRPCQEQEKDMRARHAEKLKALRRAGGEPGSLETSMWNSEWGNRCV